MVDKLAAGPQVADHVAHLVHDLAGERIVVGQLKDLFLQAFERGINVQFNGHGPLLCEQSHYHIVAREAT